MIGFTDPDRHFLAEFDECDTHQDNGHEEQHAGAVHMLKAKESGTEADAKKEGGAHTAPEDQACCISQQTDASAQAREVSLEVSALAVGIVNLVEMPNAIHDRVHTSKQDGHEASNRAEHECRCRRL